MTDTSNGRVYVDSNVLIYSVEGVPPTAEPAKRLIKTLRDRRSALFTSEIALAEVLAPSKRRGALPLHIKRRVYLDLLIWSGAVSLVPITREILIRTADLRKTLSLKLPDAIHLISAIQSSCAFFVSGDADFKKLAPGIRLVRPDEQSIDDLLQIIS
jgi:predicted nucleic acid-binding protein